MTDQNMLFALFLFGYVFVPLGLVAAWLVKAAKHQNHRIDIGRIVGNPTESDSDWI